MRKTESATQRLCVFALAMAVSLAAPAQSWRTSSYSLNRIKSKVSSVANQLKVNERKTVTIDALPRTVDEFKTLRETIGREPQGAVALTVVGIAMYSEFGQETGEACLDLCNDYLGLTGYMRSRLKEWYVSGTNDPRPYQAAAFMKGASPANGYNPTKPFTMTMTVSEKSTSSSGELVVFKLDYSGSQISKWVKVTVKKGDDGFWRVHANPSMLMKVREAEQGTEYRGLW